jgi:hypothetical protein
MSHQYRYLLCVMESDRGFDDLRAAGRAYLNVARDLRSEAVVLNAETRRHVTHEAVAAAIGRQPTPHERSDWALEDKFDLQKEGA